MSPSSSAVGIDADDVDSDADAADEPKGVRDITTRLLRALLFTLTGRFDRVGECELTGFVEELARFILM